MTRSPAPSGSPFPWRAFLRAVAVIAVPVALQNLLTTTGSMVDTMMIAPLGEMTVASVGLCAQFSSLMFSCYWGFVGGGMLFFAQYWGAQDDDGIDRSYGLTLMCMLSVGLLFGILAVFFPHVIMRLYTDKPDIQALGVEYLRIVGFAYPIRVLSMAISALLRSTERMRIPLYASIASVLTNMGLNWCLIQGHMGFPALGIRGAAFATAVAALVNAAVILALSRAQGYPYLFHFSKHFRISAAFLKEYFGKCFPILMNEILIGVGNMVINVVLGHQPAHVIAAVAVFRTLEGFVIGFFAGFSNAASVLVGKSVGAGELETAYQRARRLVPLCAGCIFCVCLALLCVRGPLLHGMGLGGASFDACCQALLIYSIAAVVRMCNWTRNDTFRSAGDATFGTVLEIVFMYLMVLPAVYLSGMRLGAPILVVFICCYCDEPIRFVLMQIHMYSGKWIRPVTDEGRAALPAFMARRRKA